MNLEFPRKNTFFRRPFDQRAGRASFPQETARNHNSFPDLDILSLDKI